MLTTPDKKLEKDDFYRFVRRQAEGRFEFDGRHIVQQVPGGTLAHSIIAKRIVEALTRQLTTGRWLVSGEGRGVETAVTVRYPDIVIEPIGAPLDSLATACPVMVVEVLLPSTESLDLGAKAVEYLTLSSLEAYAAFRQDVRECRVWQRGADGSFPARPTVIAEHDGLLSIHSLKSKIEFAVIYEAVA